MNNNFYYYNLLKREASLLYNNKTDTISNKRRVSQVVSHELAHQWVIVYD